MDFKKSYLTATSEVIKLIQEINGLKEELSSFESLIDLGDRLIVQFPLLPRLNKERDTIRRIILGIEAIFPWNISPDNLRDEKFRERFLSNFLFFGEKKDELEAIEIDLDILNHSLKEERDNFKKIRLFSLDTKEARAYWDLFVKFSLSVQRIKEKIKQIKKHLFNLKKNPFRSEISRVFRRNISFVIHLSETNPLLSGKVKIVIRHELSKDESFLSLLKGKLVRYDSADKYYLYVLSFFKEIMVHIFKEQGELFTPVYGSKINFTLKFSLGEYSGVSQGYQTAACVRMYLMDPTYKNMEIKIDYQFFLSSLTLAGGNKGFKDTLIHEFGHLFDKKALAARGTLHALRSEGLARFTEFIYGKSPPRYNPKSIKDFMIKPISSWQEYYIWIDKYYELKFGLGEFMCIMCLTFRIRQSFPSLNIDVVNKEGLNQIFENKQVYAVAVSFLRQLRNTDDRQFSELYIKYSKGLRLPLIMTEEMLRL